jgi:hypothetical protein
MADFCQTAAEGRARLPPSFCGAYQILQPRQEHRYPLHPSCPLHHGPNPITPPPNPRCAQGLLSRRDYASKPRVAPPRRYPESPPPTHLPQRGCVPKPPRHRPLRIPGEGEAPPSFFRSTQIVNLLRNPYSRPSVPRGATTPKPRATKPQPRQGRKKKSLPYSCSFLSTRAPQKNPPRCCAWIC